MDPALLGLRYDRLARWWQENMGNAAYGIRQVERALDFCARPGPALDVGCGAGGRMVRLLAERGFQVTGIDVSAEMVRLARETHPQDTFLEADIRTWDTDRRFGLVVAWDCLFHLPLASQEPVLKKLCRLLAPGGVLIYSFGDAVGEHTDIMHGETLYYSSIGIPANLRILGEAGVVCRHLELDQWPEKHVFVIGVMTGQANG